MDQLSYTLEYGGSLNFGGNVGLGAAMGMISSNTVGPITGPESQEGRFFQFDFNSVCQSFVVWFWGNFGRVTNDVGE